MSMDYHNHYKNNPNLFRNYDNLDNHFDILHLSDRNGLT